jgi:hypothetical protein
MPRFMSLILFAYLGPETLLPLTSIVATVVGVGLTFGRGTTRILRRLVPRLLSRAVSARPVPRPHVKTEPEAHTPPRATRG